MPTATYIALATTTLTTTTSSVTFSSIPATYRDLVLVAAGQTSSTAGANIQFNNDTGTNYSVVFMFGTGTTSQSEQYTAQTSIGIGAFQPSGINIHHIMDYSATDKHKTVLVRRDTDSYTVAGAGRWASTNAITSVKFNATNMTSGTVLTLYGIVS
jgi:hypothetical protein